MTSVPKPLKFLRPHYGTLKEFHVTMAESDLKKMLADIRSVLALTMSAEGERESLNYRLTGSEGDIGSWGHEYVRNLAGEIAEEYTMRQKHDIIKRRLDSNGNTIEARQDGIGATKIEKPLQKHGGRLEHNKTYCGSCYGAEAEEHECCNTCEDVREAYRKKGWGVTNPDLIDQCKREGFLQRVKDEEGEGCNIYGFLEVNKVAGYFHFAPGKSFHQ